MVSVLNDCIIDPLLQHQANNVASRPDIYWHQGPMDNLTYFPLGVNKTLQMYKTIQAVWVGLTHLATACEQNTVNCLVQPALHGSVFFE